MNVNHFKQTIKRLRDTDLQRLFDSLRIESLDTQIKLAYIESELINRRG
jgi:hypothetical protein